MKKAIILFLTVFTGFSISSCEKLFVEPDPKSTPKECFESLWQRIDEKYSFLEYKNIDWDSIKAVYEPQVTNDMNDVELFKVLDSVLYTLRDGHVNLSAPFNVSRNWEWYLGYPQNFNYSVLERNYLGDNYYITGPFVNQGFIVNQKKIGYIRYSSFSSNFSDFELDFILSRFGGADGLIIDVRDNGGGITNNVFKLMNRFTKEKTLVGYNYEKNGPGHSDFGPGYELYAEPAVDDKGEALVKFLNKPIVLLTNRSCYSATTMFVGFMSVLPNVKIVGDQTGGGGGLPVAYQLPNGWTYRFSSTYTALPDGFNIENGVPVDIHQDMDPTSESTGVDDILEKAFEQF